METIRGICRDLQVLDLSNSKLDDTMVEILMGEAKVVKKGDLVKVVKAKYKDPLVFPELRLLDIRNTKVGFTGLQIFKRCLRSDVKILR